MKNKKIIITAIILAFITVIFIGLFGLKKDFISRSGTSTTTDLMLEDKNSTTTDFVNKDNEIEGGIIKKTKEGQVYENNKYGYQIDFPENWYAYYVHWMLVDNVTNYDQPVTFVSMDYGKDSGGKQTSEMLSEKADYFVVKMENATMSGGVNTLDEYWNKKSNASNGSLVLVEKKQINGIDFILYKNSNQLYVGAVFMSGGSFFDITTKSETSLDQLNTYLKNISLI